MQHKLLGGAKDDGKLLNQSRGIGAPNTFRTAGGSDLAHHSHQRCIVLNFAHRFEDAAAACGEVLELDPRFSAAHVCLGQNYEYLGKEGDR